MQHRFAFISNQDLNHFNSAVDIQITGMLHLLCVYLIAGFLTEHM